MAIQTNELQAAVLAKINKLVPDALERETKLTSIVTGPQKRQQVGGLFIQCPIKLIANASQGFIAGAGANLDVTPSQQLQYQIFNWKYFNFNTNFSLADYNIASGPLEIVKFMKTKIEGSLQDAVRTWNIAFNGTATNALNFQGIQDMAAASGTAYGGLTDTDYASDAFLPLIYDDTDFTTISYDNFNKMATDLRLRVRGYGKGKKIMSTCNGLVYSQLKTALQNQQIFLNESEMIKAGFVGFTVDGVDVYPDADAPGTGTSGTTDNWLTMFPESIMEFWYHYGFGKKSPFDGEVRISNTTTNSYQNFVSGELINLNRRLMAVAKNIG